MALDFERCVLLDFADEGIKSGVLAKVGYFAATVADQVVVVAVAAGEIGVAAPTVGILVDPLKDSHAAQEVDGAEDGGSTNAGGLGLDCLAKLGRGKWLAPAHYLIQYDAARCGGTESLLLEAFENVVYFEHGGL